MPERTWRRWQARAHGRTGPRPLADADQHRSDGGRGRARAGAPGVGAPQSLGDHPLQRSSGVAGDHAADHARRGLLLAADYQAERRQLAAARRAVFVTPPDGPNRVWQLDFSEFETTRGGTWRIAACTDYWSKYELGWHLALTANQHDAIAAVEAAFGEAERSATGRCSSRSPTRSLGRSRRSRS